VPVSIDENQQAATSSRGLFDINDLKFSVKFD